MTTTLNTNDARTRLSLRIQSLTALLRAIPDLGNHSPEERRTVESLQYLAHELAEELPDAIERAMDEVSAVAVERITRQAGGAA